MFQFVYADKNGNAYEHERLIALGRLGDAFVEPTEEEFIPLPEGATLTMIPERTAIVLNEASEFVKYTGQGYAVGALLPQGYTRTLLPAFINDRQANPLPLYGYAAVGFREGRFYVAAKKTDVDDKWNPKHYNTGELEAKVKFLKERFASNSIVQQLARCALEYSCFTAQNIFYQRWEGGIPVSPVCNAQCVGCISLQESECCPSPQSRINKAPQVKEVVELGLHHLQQAQEAIISFGQGCEGEPSLQADLIADSIQEIRKQTDQGTINMNTNAGYTSGIAKICEAGIDSLRVSLNSANPKMYEAYYKPRNYNFADVKNSLKLAAQKGVYTYLNLLFFPGFNDCEDEVEELINLVQETGIKAIQIRNLNIDPELFYANLPKPQGQALGVPAYLEILTQELPNVALGNYSKPVSRGRFR